MSDQFCLSDIPDSEDIRQAFKGVWIGDEEVQLVTQQTPELREDIGFVVGQIVKDDINRAYHIFRFGLDSDDLEVRRAISRRCLRSARMLIERLERLIEQRQAN